MAQLTPLESIARIQENEKRFDKFINGTADDSYFTTSNVEVKSIKNFIDAKNFEINSTIFGPTLNFIGHFEHAPDISDYMRNSVYKNITDDNTYVLSGEPLSWGLYMEAGSLWDIKIESTNGTIFRVGLTSITQLIARVFKNGIEVTDQIQSSRFKWRRVSLKPQSPTADANWNTLYSSGYKQIQVDVDDVAARATFYCDILEA